MKTFLYTIVEAEKVPRIPAMIASHILKAAEYKMKPLFSEVL